MGEGGHWLPRRDGLVLQGSTSVGWGGWGEVLMEVLTSEINTVAEGNDCSDEPRRKRGGAKRSGGSATTHTHTRVWLL